MWNSQLMMGNSGTRGKKRANGVGSLRQGLVVLSRGWSSSVGLPVLRMRCG